MTPEDELLFLALGGSGEIGMNVNLYGCHGKWLMVDLRHDLRRRGLSRRRPDPPRPRVHRGAADDLVGIVLTHGHEDHIGAVPYLAADLGVPLYATPFTAGLIRGKLDEEGIADRVELQRDRGGRALRRSGRSASPIVAARALDPRGQRAADRDAVRPVFHTGDWKLDDDAGHRRSRDRGGTVARSATRASLALVCDSTNVFNAEASGSEGERPRRADRGGRQGARAGVLVTTFASNVARLQTLGEVAQGDRAQAVRRGPLARPHHRGRARRAAICKDFPETVDFDTAMRLPRGEVLIVATGGQGEPRAALARIADGSHPIALEQGDTVVFSSKQIPGNEVAIGAHPEPLAAQGRRDGHRPPGACPRLRPSGPARAGADVRLDPARDPGPGPWRDAPHGGAGALRAVARALPHALVQANGDIVRLAPGPAKKIGDAPVGRLVLDGDVILPADGSTINERRKLALNGQISVAVAIGKGGRADRPSAGARSGCAGRGRARRVRGRGRARRRQRRWRTARRGTDKLREDVRLAVRRVATRWTGKKPIVDVLVIEG